MFEYYINKPKTIKWVSANKGPSGLMSHQLSVAYFRFVNSIFYGGFISIQTTEFLCTVVHQALRTFGYPTTKPSDSEEKAAAKPMERYLISHYINLQSHNFDLVSHNFVSKFETDKNKIHVYMSSPYCI